jgi:hypothetical protein
MHAISLRKNAFPFPSNFPLRYYCSLHLVHSFQFTRQLCVLMDVCLFVCVPYRMLHLMVSIFEYKARNVQTHSRIFIHMLSNQYKQVCTKRVHFDTFSKILNNAYIHFKYVTKICDLHSEYKARNVQTCSRIFYTYVVQSVQASLHKESTFRHIFKKL